MNSPALPVGGLDPVIEALQNQYLPEIADYDLGGLLCDARLGRCATVSSFGAESVVLLHYVSRFVPDIDVLFIDTAKHFRATLEYRDAVAVALNLNLINIAPDLAELAKEDPYGSPFNIDVNVCCTLRKVFALQDALRGYDSWVSGRKRSQAPTRAAIPLLERDTDKINPLAFWTKQYIDLYFAEHDLSRHPLEARGSPSIGCQPCTRAVKPC
jgi:phosphoadenosine phosphosulfate reductase